jgi:D-apiose dehydrogenase
VCDSDAAKETDCAARWSIPRAYTSAAAMLEHETLDLLDIVTPPPSHLALIRLAAEHGIATICQKPFCGSLEEAELAAVTCPALPVQAQR